MRSISSVHDPVSSLALPDNESIQTIAHPAVVWSVAVAPHTGEIVSGCSDHVIRVWSQIPSRQAPLDIQNNYTEKIQLQAIPQCVPPQLYSAQWACTVAQAVRHLMCAELWLTGPSLQALCWWRRRRRRPEDAARTRLAAGQHR